MRDTHLYETLLGLEKPWRVTSVDVNLAELQVHVFVDHDDVSFRCAKCDHERSLHDHQPERVWRHLDTMQYTTLLHARPPRVHCPEHGVGVVNLPWAGVRSRFTLLFERFAIDVLLLTSVGSAAKLLGISWDEAWQIKRKAVERGLARKPKAPPVYIGVDEKSFKKGQDSYMTIVCDLDEGNVEWVGDDRTAECLGQYLKQFTEAQRDAIHGFAVDMWRPYAKAIRENVTDSDKKIIYDRFHVMQEINEALDLVRKGENRELRALGLSTLIGSKYLWLRASENVPRFQRKRFAGLKHLKLKTARAWAIKEMLRHLWDFKTLSRARAFFKRWYGWACRSRLTPVIKAAKKLMRHFERIMNYFTHRITNAMAESINGRIERLSRIANGFRNRNNFKVAILFHHGGLNLYP